MAINHDDCNGWQHNDHFKDLGDPRPPQGDLAALMPQVATLLCGTPNARRSSKTESRFGTNGSLSINLQRGTWFDHEVQTGGGVLDLIAYKTGRTGKDRRAWLVEKGLLEAKPAKRARPHPVATYDYRDAEGVVRYQVLRYEPKDFRQRRSDLCALGGWRWDMRGVVPLPYRLPELRAAIARGETVLIVEGEKDADAGAHLGFAATCNHGGASKSRGKWRPELNAHFAGAHVVLVPDNDEVGRAHMIHVATDLAGVAVSIRTLDLACVWPACPKKGGDLSDWIAQAGGTREQLLCYIENTPVFSAETAAGPTSDPPRPNGQAATHQDSGGLLPVIPSEAALSDALVDRHGNQLRYVAAWSKWLRYDGKVWSEEKTHFVRHLTKELCQELAGEADTRELRSIASSRTVNGVQTLAQADRCVAATVEQWDADPWLLNTPAGMIDLRTCAVSQHSPDHHATKITGAAPADSAECPRWKGFLNRIFGGDADLTSYMQRVLGYSLTGITREHAMFFAYGAGGNGKSVMLDTVAGIMGDYHTTAPIDTFTVSMGDRHPTELADLVGARLVTAIETEQGRAWAEARIKMLTGGDRVKARFMRQDFFEFRPQFKLMVAGNHQPVLRAVDEAIKRRFNLLPFEVTVPTAERDPDLAQKLRAEWPAILRWSLDGCLAWQRHGLQPPTAVTDATGRYLEAQDAIGAWFDEACEAKSTFRESASALYISWKAYADRNGEVAGSQKSFGSQLEARSFRRIKSAKANFYLGLRLVRGQPPTPP